jgi:hypothetical protein
MNDWENFDLIVLRLRANHAKFNRRRERPDSPGILDNLLRGPCPGRVVARLRADATVMKVCAEEVDRGGSDDAFGGEGASGASHDGLRSVG